MIQRSVYDIRKAIFYQLDSLLNFQWQMFKAYSERDKKKRKKWMELEWVSDCCLTPIQEFFSYIMARPTRWIFIVLAHWNNSSPLSGIGDLSWFLLPVFCLGNDHLTWKGWGGWFFSNVAEKNILILVEEEKKLSDSEFLSYNLMLNSEKKYILTLVLSEKKILNEKQKTITPSCKLNDRSFRPFGFLAPNDI
jgi:hypothetical protein